MGGDTVGCTARKRSKNRRQSTDQNNNTCEQTTMLTEIKPTQSSRSRGSRRSKSQNGRKQNGAPPTEDLQHRALSLNQIHSQIPRVRVYKIVMLGDGGVGKSAVTLQFVQHSFTEFHDPTIEDAYQQQAVIDGEAALLDILDTAGQVEFTAMRDQYMRCGEGFMICYSVTDRHSFEEALEYRKLITRVRLTEDIPLVLIGNKMDLLTQRKVSIEEGKCLAKEFGCPFFETSAILRQFIDEAYHTLVREIRKKDKDTDSTWSTDDNDGKTKKRSSRWWRIRSIFALVFRRKRNYN